MGVGEESAFPQRRNRWAAVIGLLLLAALAAAWFSPLRDIINPRSAVAWLHSVRQTWWAPLVFIGLYCLFNILLIPGTLLSLTAGVLWGWAVGGLWVVAASTAGSALPFLLAKTAAGGWLEDRLRRRAGALGERLSRQGFLTLLLLRLIPIVPYNILNYAAGFAGMRWRDYLPATFLGTLPGIFIFTYLADSIAAGVTTPRAAFLRVLLAGTLLGGLAVATKLLASRVQRRIGR